MIIITGRRIPLKYHNNKYTRYKKITRSTADAAEPRSPQIYLRVANTQIKFSENIFSARHCITRVVCGA